ncbi:MAG: RNA polymerase sigma factor [Candidatus Metalachnospira sp.]|nr:RNA polymerase sigma factor [Candidatus Metalachnospira sp.]
MLENEIFLSNAMDLHGNAVYRVALCRLQNVADAEDIFQDVFLSLLKEKNVENWNPEHLKAWLLRVTINTCHNMARNIIRRQTLSLDEIPELTSEVTESDNELWEALGCLPAKYRIVVLLYYVEGYKTEEIAKIMECPDATVRSRLHRGRQKLKEMIGGILYDESFQ